MKLKNYPWAANFQVQEEVFKKWENEKSVDSFLFWTLKSNILAISSYFEWAKDHYQIPKLKNLFIENNSLSKEQWKRIKDLEEWTKEFAPLYEAQSTIYIACLEPPKEKKNYRFVLAEPSFLEAHWKRINSFEELKAVEEPAKELKAVSFPEEPTPRHPILDEPEELQRGDDTNPRKDQEINMNSTSTNFTSVNLEAKEDSDFSLDVFDPYFISIAFLEVKSDSFVILEARKMKFKNKKFIPCEPKNFLEITKRGHIYNGFVINNEVNKKFFDELGQSTLPNYVTAIPIKEGTSAVKKIILGTSIKFISGDDVKKIKNIVYSHFKKSITLVAA